MVTGGGAWLKMLVFVESIPLQNWYHSSIKKGLLEKLWLLYILFIFYICMYIHVYTCVKEAGEGKDKCIAHIFLSQMLHGIPP